MLKLKNKTTYVFNTSVNTSKVYSFIYSLCKNAFEMTTLYKTNLKLAIIFLNRNYNIGATSYYNKYV